MNNNNINSQITLTQENFTELQQKILEIIKRGKPSLGVSINEIIQKLSHYNPEDINTSIQLLFDDGHLYNTISLEHYSAL